MENATTPDAGDEYEGLPEGYDWDKIFESIPIMSAVIYSVVCVLGVLGNSVVIWATGFRMKKSVSTVWYLNLAMADFLVTAFLVLQIIQKALFHWPFGWFMCKMDGLVFYMNMYATIYTLALISVDRCVCVVCPVWTQNHRTIRKASWVSLGVWLLALATSIPNLIFRDTVHIGEDKEYCHDTVVNANEAWQLYVSRMGAIIITQLVLGFVVPFSIIVSCYSVIIYRLRNTHSLASQSGRSFKIIATVVATFFLCWIPYHIIRLIYVCGLVRLIEPSDTLGFVIFFGDPITLTLALVNSCVNPLLYVFSQGFKDVFRSRSILKVLEKAFAEEPCQSNNTPVNPDLTQMNNLPENPKTPDLSP